MRGNIARKEVARETSRESAVAAAAAAAEGAEVKANQRADSLLLQPFQDQTGTIPQDPRPTRPGPRQE
jgi:hypothetical protein